jgi:hypothetical protein
MRHDHRRSVVGVAPGVVGEEIFEIDVSAGKDPLIYLKTQNSCQKKRGWGERRYFVSRLNPSRGI